jgi:hypothetical protein
MPGSSQRSTRKEKCVRVVIVPQSSSASRFTAGALGFLLLSQSGDRQADRKTDKRIRDHAAALRPKNQRFGPKGPRYPRQEGHV